MLHYFFSGGLLATLMVFGQQPAGVGPQASEVVELNRRLEQARERLAFERPTGYLRSVLQALDVPVESQIVVFSKTSLMHDIISPRNPRTLYFNDEITVGWVPGEPFLEVAAADAREGIAFYVLDQRPNTNPAFYRHMQCRSCHEGFSTLPIPRMIVRSIFTALDGTPIRTLGEFDTDDRSPLRERWGGWYVTGHSGRSPHLGNNWISDSSKPPTSKRRHLDSLSAKFDTRKYLTPYSDVVALLVFEHQMRVLNLLAQVSLDVRFTEYATGAKNQALSVPGNASDLVRDGINELVDSLLFVGAMQLDGPINGTSGFAEVFAARGPRDSQGRSLRQFDLKTGLLRYSCSYLIYSRTFESLPAAAKHAVYRRLWGILSKEVHDPKYAYLTFVRRKAIVEILRETKDGLPEYFRPINR